jgi:hypothetical protein
MKKNLLFFCLALFFSNCFFSQNNSNASIPKKKDHYRIINNGSDDPLWYEKAMSHAQGMDSLRFLSQRRHISIQGTSLVLELFSAQELLDTYGKPISLLTITDPSKARKVKIKLNSKNMIEVVGQ